MAVPIDKVNLADELAKKRWELAMYKDNLKLYEANRFFTNLSLVCCIVSVLSAVLSLWLS